MQVLGIPANQLVTSPELLEQSMGVWEGAKRAECYTPHILKRIESDTHGFAPAGGESQRDVEVRLMNFLSSVVLQASTAQRPISLVFGHGMAFKCVLRHILDSDARMSRKIALHNTSITEIGYLPQTSSIPGSIQAGWHILRVNDSGHLLADNILQEDDGR
jgi:broad specificity phosphatase PhoE